MRLNSIEYLQHLREKTVNSLFFEKFFTPIIIGGVIILSFGLVLISEKNPNTTPMLKEDCYYHDTYMVGKVTMSRDTLMGESSIELINDGDQATPSVVYDGLGDVNKVYVRANYMRDKVGFLEGKYRVLSYHQDIKKDDSYLSDSEPVIIKLRPLKSTRLANVEVDLEIDNGAFCSLRING